MIPRTRMIRVRAGRILPPVILLLALVAVWEGAVHYYAVPRFVLPAPSAIAGAFVTDGAGLFMAALATLKVTLMALAAAFASGVLLSLAFSLSRTVERALFPFAVLLQVTPIVSIAPLVLIWVGIDHVERALVIIAWLAAFFPILANMSAGLRAVDADLEDLFRLYGASGPQRFWLLLWPTALPFMLAGLKVSAGLALIGAVVAEFVAGSGGATGLAWRLLEAGNRLQMEKMFAGLILLAVIGVGLFFAFSTLEAYLLRHRRRS